ncbi:30S ribosomal protein S4e [uncultured archaeon]|nr:30S ribosomal protein S4e [uncultured archaeon]
MGKKGGTRHLKRIAMPQSFSAPRKVMTWIKKPLPGRHAVKGAISLSQAVRDLGFAMNSRESKLILANRKILVDGIVRVEMKDPVGFMDVITVGEKNWRAILDGKGRIVMAKTTKPDLKLCQVRKKVRMKGGKVQLTLHDGRNVIGFDAKVGDTVEVSLPDGKPKGKIALKAGSKCFVIGGKKIGRIGTIEELVPGSATRLSEAKCKLEDGIVYTTLKEYLFPITDGTFEAKKE